ncbi:MAG: hypothetical protein U9R25_10940 [Chloroflexota bacterium]|nr:hypothetical protein [Chloroflexota bacterium]
MKSAIRGHWPIVLILAVFLALGIIYSVINPLFESPDEVWHYEYVRWLVEDRGLPRPEQVGEAPWHQEGSQPPLYYLTAALLTGRIPTDNADEIIRYNPHAAIGQPGSSGNKNVIVHGPADSWPWQGVALAAHLTRFFSLLLGAVTVLAAYGTSLAIFPNRQALASLAAALVAFNPQFLFLSAAVNNDSLVIAASASAIWLIIIMLGRQEPAPPGSTIPVTPALRSGTVAVEDTSVRSQDNALRVTPRQAAPTTAQLALLGLLVGIAALAKLSGLALVGLAGLTLLIISIRRESLRELLRWALIVGVVVLAVAGWWYLRNWQLYGDPLGLKAMFDILPRRAEPPTVDELLSRAPGVWQSAWAVFGWFNVPADKWIYSFYTAIALFGAIGLLVVWPLRFIAGRRRGPKQRTPRFGGRSPATPGNQGSRRRTSSRPSADRYTLRLPRHTWLQLFLLVVWCVVILLALLNWAQMRYPQGRLLFPAISAAAVLIAYGLAGWVPRSWQTGLVAVLTLLMFLFAALAPFRWIAPAYAAPPMMRSKPAGITAVDATFGDQIRLAGYHLENQEARPGEELHLTLYWQAMQSLPADYSVFVHLVDENGILQAQQDSYPGEGALATSDWPLGVLIPDQHVVRIPETAPAPHRLKVNVGLYDYDSNERLTVGDYDHWTVGQVALLPRSEAGKFPNQVSINFDDQIALLGFDFDRRVMAPGESLALTLWWQALAVPAQDYVVFTHLVLPPSSVWAQSDEMPQLGAAPTSGWQPGQQIEDHYTLTLPPDAPPGVYFVEIGIYDPATNDRLQVDFSDKGIILGQVKVEKPQP